LSALKICGWVLRLGSALFLMDFSEAREEFIRWS
jgi:hypothetical protein